MAAPLDTPAYKRVLAERPGLPGVRGPEVGRRCRRSCGARSSVAIAYQPDDLAALAARCACPTARASSASRTRRSSAPSQRDGRRDPGRAARRDPRRRSLAAVREPRRVDRRAHAASSRRCPRPRGSRRGGARRSARGRGAAARTASTRCSRCRAGISSCSTTARCRPTCGSSTRATSRPRRSRPRAGRR